MAEESNDSKNAQREMICVAAGTFMYGHQCAFRIRHKPSYRHRNIGFRVGVL